MRGSPSPAPGSPPLVAVAHGSRDVRSAATVRALCEQIRQRRPGLRVVPAFLDHCGPRVDAVLDRLAGEGVGEVVAVPLLLTAAYHSKTDLPAVLSAARNRLPGLRVRYARTLGPDPLLLAAAERRLREAGVWPGEPDTAVVLAAAGSTDPAAEAVLAEVAGNWRRRGWWDVDRAFASALPPTVAEAVAALRQRGARQVAVSSYFLAPGELPDRVHSGGADVVSPVLGDAPEVAALVLRRYDETTARPLSAHPT